MKLSIITCTYNSEKYLQQCINSVMAQNLKQNTYEHIFVDAFSDDKTITILENYKKKYSNVKIIQRKPKGVYNAMNEGIKEAKGEYILCLNSDDYLEKNALNNYLKYVETTGNKDLYHAKLNFIKDNKITIIPNHYIRLQKILFKLSCNIFVCHPTVLCKRTTFIEMGLFDENKKIASDFGMRLKYNKEHKTIIFYPKVVTNFVQHGNNISANLKALAEEQSYFRKKYYGIIGIIIDKILYLSLIIRGNI